MASGHGDRLAVAILWHQHQPMYRARPDGDPRGSYLLPWVRLHAVRDYYSMAALLCEFPAVHLTINLAPSLIRQIEDYVEHGATDVAMELSLTPTEQLSRQQRDFIIGRFFDADWHNEVTIYPRYTELLDKRRSGVAFSDRDITDLKMWFNLAWFPPEMRRAGIVLCDGTSVCVSEHIDKAEGFDQNDIAAVIDEQYKIMRNIIPMHRKLSDEGQIEISVSPLYHPILPLLADTDRATIDRPGALLPPRFSWPEDARSQMERAVQLCRERFGKAPAGMWPSEGAVGEHIVGAIAEAGFRWIATDQGVLAKSGRFGYDTSDPDVLLKPYVVGPRGRPVSVFFRHTQLSDDIGFNLQKYSDYDVAAGSFLSWIRDGFAKRVRNPADRIISIALDGENAWGSYRNSGRELLRGIYRRLSNDADLVSVTFSEFIDGAPERGVSPHPPEKQERVSPLFTASWIDEAGSAPGNDLGVWIGGREENRAWELLGRTRQHMADVGATPLTHPAAFEALYAAEGSDWFWWFGDDFATPAGGDSMLGRLFREHLRTVYRQLGEEPPVELDAPIAVDEVVWSRTDPVAQIARGQGLRILEPGPGALRWTADAWKTEATCRLESVGRAMAKSPLYMARLGPFGGDVERVEFIFQGEGGVSDGETHAVRIADGAGEAA